MFVLLLSKHLRSPCKCLCCSNHTIQSPQSPHQPPKLRQPQTCFHATCHQPTTNNYLQHAINTNYVQHSIITTFPTYTTTLTTWTPQHTLSLPTITLPQQTTYHTTAHSPHNRQGAKPHTKHTALVAWCVWQLLWNQGLYPNMTADDKKNDLPHYYPHTSTSHPNNHSTFNTTATSTP